jgi:hypothetical protein
VKYLTTTMANTAVLSNCAGSPNWIECLIDKNSPPHLLERDANVWFAQGLADLAAATWALGAPPTIKAIVVQVAKSRLAVSQVPLPDVMHQFWRLYVTAFGGKTGSEGLDRLGLRASLRAATADYFTIESVVEIVRPRLQLAVPFASLGFVEDGQEPSGPSTRDLCHLTFEGSL